MEPIGIFSSSHTYAQQTPRQGTLDKSGRLGVIELNRGHNFEQALEDLAGFDKIWLIYLFHKNNHWRTKVQPPRSTTKKGVFATRAPFRPNPIGISCVTLENVSGRKITVSQFDLLDGTPILDIKPYIPYADAFPEAKTGWIQEHPTQWHQILWDSTATEQAQWIFKHMEYDIHSFIHSQLTEFPTGNLYDKRSPQKRVKCIDKDKGLYSIGARTWRVHYQVNAQSNSVTVKFIQSGYSSEELVSPEDKYGDKGFHKEFLNKW